MVYYPRSLVSNQMDHRIDGILLAEELAQGLKPIRKGKYFLNE